MDNVLMSSVRAFLAIMVMINGVAVILIDVWDFTTGSVWLSGGIIDIHRHPHCQALAESPPGGNGFVCAGVVVVTAPS